MLDVTILKVYHSGEAEARKLEPYIAQADVFFLEHSECTEAQARGLEDEWNGGWLQSPVSNSDFA